MADFDARLEEIERRLDRLERLAFVTFQDVRSVADYAYKNVRLEVEADEVKRIPGFLGLSDNEVLKVGLAIHELAEFKLAVRVLRKQVRRDALTIVRDSMLSRRAATQLEEVSHDEREAKERKSGAIPVPPLSDREARTADVAR